MGGAQPARESRTRLMKCQTADTSASVSRPAARSTRVPVRMRKLALLGFVAAAVWAAPANATPAGKYGIQDDNYILNGPGKLTQRLDTIDKLGVNLVRFTIRWDEVERRQGRLNWGRTDQVLRGLNNRRIQVVAALVGTPAWANGGRPPRFAPPSGKDFATFAAAAADRYPFVRYWLIWNEPNLKRW